MLDTPPLNMDVYITYCTQTNYFLCVQTILCTHKTFSTQINMMYAYNTPLYEHTTFCTHTKYLVRIHKFLYMFYTFLMGTHLLYTCNMVMYVSSFKTPFYLYKMVLYAYNIWYTYKILCTRKKLFSTYTKPM